MLNFLNPAVLIAAIAALIPLLIHLFSKRQVKVIPFSSLKHLKEMQKRQVRRIKIRQLLLLALRMLIILAAALAFARPATKGGYIGSHAGVSAVILLDRSGSMQRQVKDGQLFDLAKKKALEILENFGQADETAPLTFDRQIYFPAGANFLSRETAEKYINEISCGYDSTNLGEALKKAGETLREAKNLNKELYILSDYQSNSLPPMPESTLQGVAVYLIDFPLETDGNSGAIGVDLGGQLIEVGANFSAAAEIANYDDRAKEEQLASLFIDGVRVMQTGLRLAPKGKETAVFACAVKQPGFHSGWTEISDDGLPADNRFYFSFRIPEQFNVLIIDGDGSGRLFNLALTPSEELARHWSVKSISPDQFSSVRLGDYDAVIFVGVSSLGKTETAQLRRYLDGGGGLLYALGENSDPDYFNENFGHKIDLTIDKPLPANVSRAGYYAMERMDYSHPIFMPFSELQKDTLPTFRFFALPEIIDGPRNRDLAYFSNGRPAIVEDRFGLGKVILLVGSIRPEYSDFASHSFFVPFTIRTMEYLSGDVSAYEYKNLVGQPVKRSVSIKEAELGPAQLITPDNRAFLLNGEEKGDRTIYDCRPIDAPGIYRLVVGGRTIDQFPANMPQAEGDLTSEPLDKYGKKIGASNYKIIPFNESPGKVVSEARFGRELWKIFLWAAALIMATEMILSRETPPVVE
jgi:hypothetical protein